MSHPSFTTALPPDSRAEAPQSLVLGIGCRSGISGDQIDAAVRAALGARRIADVERVATIASKAREPAVIEFCARNGLPLVAFSPDVINEFVKTEDSLAPSPAARAHLGVECVCEPCALLAAPGGILIEGKRALNGVTVAIASAPSPQ